jgi:hypothetical protein
MEYKNIPAVKEMGGKILDLANFIDKKDTRWYATNPSIAHSPKHGYAITLRSTNYYIDKETGMFKITDGDQIKSTIWYSELDKNFKIKKLRKIDVSRIPIPIVRGLEDPKLFWKDDKWYFTAVFFEPGYVNVPKMCLCILDTDTNSVVDFSLFSGPEMNRMEKNWMFPSENNDHFDFIYSANAKIKKNIMTTVIMNNVELDDLRGNSNLLKINDEQYLAILHKKYILKTNWFADEKGQMQPAGIKDYQHYFGLYDKYGKLLSLSTPFRFMSPGVEFAAGLSEYKDNYIVSFGKEDVSSHLAFIPKKSLTNIMRVLNYDN